MEDPSLVALVQDLALPCTICVTGRLERGRSLHVPESLSRSYSDLLTAKSAHTLGEMLLPCSPFLGRRKQNALWC